jgi:hypothetical protein
MISTCRVLDIRPAESTSGLGSGALSGIVTQVARRIDEGDDPYLWLKDPDGAGDAADVSAAREALARIDAGDTPVPLTELRDELGL